MHRCKFVYVHTACIYVNLFQRKLVSSIRGMSCWRISDTKHEKCKRPVHHATGLWAGWGLFTRL